MSIDTTGIRGGGPQAKGDVEPILSVRDVGVEFSVDRKWVMASSGVNFDLYPGEVLAIVGESGSGKSVTTMGLIGLLAANGRIHGSAKLLGTELIGAKESTLRSVRGRQVGLIFQEPMTALNPVLRVGFQLTEMLLAHWDMSPAAAEARAIELLELVEIPDPKRRFSSFPHEMSGGQRQRVVIAMALACDPWLLIADEPTTALDVTVQAEILDLMRNLHRKLNSAIVLITHDMGVVADLADNVIVMRDGVIVEAAEIHDLYNNPKTDYTRTLLDAVPHLGSEIAKGELEVRESGPTATEAKAADKTLALEIKDLVIEYPGRFREPPFRAVDGVSFSIAPGEVLGLVGESGSGKTTIGRAVVGLLKSTSGEIRIGGDNIVGLKEKQLRPMRTRFAIVFQDPAASLNPRMNIGESIGEPLLLHGHLNDEEIAARLGDSADPAARARLAEKGRLKTSEINTRVEQLLDQVQLPMAYRNRYPHELSGGQRQRVGIARALALGPELLVADEPTSALDVSVQAKVLELFQELQKEYGFACLFISHDLAVVEILAREIAVLYKGRLADFGPRERILTQPGDDYTKALLAAAPVPDPDQQKVRREARQLLKAETAAKEKATSGDSTKA